MKYTSTRDDNVRVGSARAVIDGISADGGLYVPLELPKIDFETLGDDYFMRAERVLSVFFDFDVKGITERAYSTFDGDPAPVVKIDDDLFVLELWHGKTCAFKDMALSVLPSLLVNAKAYENENDETLVLVATRPLTQGPDAALAAPQGRTCELKQSFPFQSCFCPCIL